MAEINDELLIKFLLEETTAREEAVLKDWIAADPANKKHFAQIQTIWNTSRSLIGQAPVDPNRAWERFKVRRDAGFAQKEATVKPLWASGQWLKIAAVLLMLAGGAWTMYSYLYGGYITLASATSVQKGTLPDGSDVFLNKNTSLSYQKGFEGKERRVELDSGEVFFRVTPDKARPFVVDAGEVTVSVLGTAFNVRHDREETEIIVESGVVEVRSEHQRLLLRRGEKVSIRKQSPTLRKEEITDSLHNYFRSNRFEANDIPLGRVVEVLNEAYDADIVLADPRLNDLRLTTTFQTGSLDTILSVIAETFELRVEKSGRQILLKNR